MKKCLTLFMATVVILALSCPTAFAATSAEIVPIEGQLVAKVDHGCVTDLAAYGGPPADFNGFLGTIVQVGNYPLTVTSLGRLFYEDNSQSHEIKLVDAATGEDIPGASVTVSGGETDKFTFARLEVPVTLEANKTYYLLSNESSSGDFFSDSCDFMYPDSVAACTGFVRQDADGYYTFTAPNSGYVSLNMKFMYTPNESPEGEVADLFMDVQYNLLRNDYHSFIGMKIAIGEEDLVVTEMGRFWLEGNQQEHAIKIVDAETKAEIPGASVVVSSGIPGSFSYVKLQTPVTLKANHMYWILSREYFEGDTWLDIDSKYLLTDDNAAALLGGANYIIDYEDHSNVNHSFVGINLRYLTAKEETPSTAIQITESTELLTETADGNRQPETISPEQSAQESGGTGNPSAAISVMIAVVIVIAIAAAVVVMKNKKK